MEVITWLCCLNFSFTNLNCHVSFDVILDFFDCFMQLYVFVLFACLHSDKFYFSLDLSSINQLKHNISFLFLFCNYYLLLILRIYLCVQASILELYEKVRALKGLPQEKVWIALWDCLPFLNIEVFLLLSDFSYF